MSSAVTSPSLPYTPAVPDVRKSTQAGTSAPATGAAAAPSTVAPAAPGQQDVATRQALPSQTSTTVANAEPYNAVYGQLAPTFKQAGLTPLTDKEMKAVSSEAQNAPGVQKLVTQVKTSVTSGAAAPSTEDYEQEQQNFVTNLISKNSGSSSADGTGGAGGADPGSPSAIVANCKNPAMLLMYVFTQAKGELLQEKQQDLKNLQRFSTISDLLTNVMNSQILPAQQSLEQKVSGAKSADQYKQTVPLTGVPQNPSLDYYKTNTDGSASLIDTPSTAATASGTSKSSGTASNTTTLNTTSMTALLGSYQNLTQQVQQRMQSEQTTYSGHDSQDSTLSNIISSTLSTFKDSQNNIVHNIG